MPAEPWAEPRGPGPRLTMRQIWVYLTNSLMGWRGERLVFLGHQLTLEGLEQELSQLGVLP